MMHFVRLGLPPKWIQVCEKYPENHTEEVFMGPSPFGKYASKNKSQKERSESTTQPTASPIVQSISPSVSTVVSETHPAQSIAHSTCPDLKALTSNEQAVLLPTMHASLSTVSSNMHSVNPSIFTVDPNIAAVDSNLLSASSNISPNVQGMVHMSFASTGFGSSANTF